jgi:RimJ/RimL family protein N-acetyltransferase
MNKMFKIRGKKVNLRTLVQSDIEDYKRWEDPDLEAWKYDGPWYGADTSGMAERVEKVFLDGQEPPYKRLEIETVEGKHIGWITVRQPRNDPHMTEFGIDITEADFCNRSPGTEAVYLWLDYLFREREFTRIGFSTWDGNKRMIAVGKKLGFVEEARIRRGCRVEGRFYDRIKMGILKEEWEAMKKNLNTN